VGNVPIRSVTPMHLMERLGQRLLAAWDHDHVHVVRHQAISHHRQLVLSDGPAQQVQVNHPLGITVQYEMATISSLRYMMRGIHNNYTG